MADPSWVAQVKQIFDNAGVPAEVWVPIMLHESGANPGAVNDTRGKTVPAGQLPEYSIGLFQINVAAKFPNDLAAQEQLATQLKDPAWNATYAAQAMAPAWAAVSADAKEVDPRNWPWLVGVRSGWPAGSVQYPCTTTYCNSLQEGFAGVFDRWMKAWNAQGAGDLISPYFNGNQPNDSRGSGQSAYNSVVAAPGYPVGGGSIYDKSSGGGGGGLASPISPTAAAAAQAGASASAIEKALGSDASAWLKTPAAVSVLFFIIGTALFLIGVAAIIFEQQKRAGREVLEITKAPVKEALAL